MCEGEVAAVQALAQRAARVCMLTGAGTSAKSVIPILRTELRVLADVVQQGHRGLRHRTRATRRANPRRLPLKASSLLWPHSPQRERRNVPTNACVALHGYSMATPS